MSGVEQGTGRLPRRPVLAYDRVDENRRRTRFILFAFAAAILPFFLFLTQYVAEVLAMIVGGALFGFSESHLWSVIGISLLAAVVLVLGATAYVYRHAVGLTLRLSGARRLSPDEEPRLRRSVENLCIGAGLPPPRLYVVETKATNLCSTGMGRQDASLLVTRGLLEALAPRELEGVVAQELSQVGNEDIRPATVVGAIVAILWWPVHVVRLLVKMGPWVIRLGQSKGTLTRLMVVIASLVLLPFLLPLATMAVAFAFMPVLLLFLAVPMVGLALEIMSYDPTAGWMILGMTALTVYVFDVVPIIGYLLRRRLGHRQEFRSDADALLLTRHPTGLARALAKMTVGGNAELSVNPALPHLFLVDPLPVGFRRWLLSTHPPVEERIDALISMAGIDPREIDEARAEGLAYRKRRRSTEPAGQRPPLGIRPPVVAKPTRTGERNAGLPRTLQDEFLPADVVRSPDPPQDAFQATPLCGLVRGSAGEYLDEQVNPAVASEIRGHLASCPSCDDYMTRRIQERLGFG